MKHTKKQKKEAYERYDYEAQFLINTLDTMHMNDVDKNYILNRVSNLLRAYKNKLEVE